MVQNTAEIKIKKIDNIPSDPKLVVKKAITPPRLMSLQFAMDKIKAKMNQLAELHAPLEERLTKNSPRLNQLGSQEYTENMVGSENKLAGRRTRMTSQQKQAQKDRKREQRLARKEYRKKMRLERRYQSMQKKLDRAETRLERYRTHQKNNSSTKVLQVDSRLIAMGLVYAAYRQDKGLSTAGSVLRDIFTAVGAVAAVGTAAEMGSTADIPMPDSNKATNQVKNPDLELLQNLAKKQNSVDSLMSNADDRSKQEYEKLSRVLSQTPTTKKEVRQHNKAITKMSRIVNRLVRQFNREESVYKKQGEHLQRLVKNIQNNIAELKSRQNSLSPGEDNRSELRSEQERISRFQSDIDENETYRQVAKHIKSCTEYAPQSQQPREVISTSGTTPQQPETQAQDQNSQQPSSPSASAP